MWIYILKLYEPYPLQSDEQFVALAQRVLRRPPDHVLKWEVVLQLVL